MRLEKNTPSVFQRIRGAQNLCKGVAKCVLANLAKVHCELHERQRALVFDRPAQTNRFTKIALVLHPVEMDVQMAEDVRIDAVLFDQRQKRGHHFARNFGPASLNMVDVQDHERINNS